MLDLAVLNPPQREAVLHGDGPLVVFAGAGSGKTRVITFRVAHLVQDRGIPPWSILAVTFTNKAAGEMRERLAPLLGPDAARLNVGTFHASCARILRYHAERLGLRKDFTIYDDQDQQAMLKRLLKELDIDDREVPVRVVQSRINTAKNEMQTPATMAGRDFVSEAVRRVFELYEERMRAASAMDFGDLVYRLVLALEADDDFRRELSSRYRYILVDEFQDTNHAQLRLVRALCSVHGNLCVVGDDDQSIYRWRGADRRNILEFREAFPGAHVVKLEQNYRSTQRILRVAHEVIRRNREREPKRLWTENDEGAKVLVVRTEDERAEAQMVVRGVRQLVDDGLSPTEIAVFYRTHAQSRVFEETLRASGIPYRIVGGMRFFERAEVKDLLAYLRLLVNPFDDVSCLRVINVPTRGIGKTTIDRVVELASKRGESILETLRGVEPSDELPKAARSKLGSFVALVDGLRKALEDGESLGVLVRDVVERTGYEAMLRAEDSAEADARLENLAELVGSIAEYEARTDDATLAGFLEQVTLDTEVEEAAGRERITLMTVHAAKGLEFDTVMVTGLEEDMFPYRGMERGSDPEEMEEERRLAYVAFTRARKRLVLSCASVRRIFGQMRPGTPSRFLSELPPDDVEWLDSRPRSAQTSSYGGSAYGSGGSAYGSAGHGVSSYGAASRTAGAPVRRPLPGADEVAPVRPAPRSERYVDTSDGDLSMEHALRRGARVTHPKFGAGVVREVVQGLPPKVTVHFDSVGAKTVVATYLSLA